MYHSDAPQHELTKRYQEKISNEHILEHYPFLREGEEYNQDLIRIHPLMLSYYVLLGKELGQIATTEAVMFDEDQRIAAQMDTRENTARRADSAWFDPSDYRMRCAVEFQFAGKKVEEKARHLLQYADAHRDIELLILHLWSTNRGDPDDDVISMLRSGYKKENGVSFDRPSADILVMKSLFESEGESYRLRRTYEAKIFPDPHA